MHELAEAYGCDSQAFDEEPRRNVVVYTTRCVCSSCVFCAVEREKREWEEGGEAGGGWGGRDEREGVDRGSEEGLGVRRRYIDKGGENLSCMYFGGSPGSYTPTA